MSHMMNGEERIQVDRTHAKVHICWKQPGVFAVPRVDQLTAQR